jgi:hypothetical protein
MQKSFTVARWNNKWFLPLNMQQEVIHANNKLHDPEHAITPVKYSSFFPTFQSTKPLFICFFVLGRWGVGCFFV